MPSQQSFSIAVEVHSQAPCRQWICANQVPEQLLQFICACGTFAHNLRWMQRAYSYMALAALHTTWCSSGLVWLLTSCVLRFGNVLIILLLFSIMENIFSRSSAFCNGFIPITRITMIHGLTTKLLFFTQFFIQKGIFIHKTSKVCHASCHVPVQLCLCQSGSCVSPRFGFWSFWRICGKKERENVSWAIYNLFWGIV